MRKFPTILLTGLLLAPTACGTAETEPGTPTVTETVTAAPAEPTSSDVAETPTAETGQESESAEPVETGEPTPSATETEVASEPAESPSEQAGEVLSFTGLGEFNLGDTDMVERGAMVLEPECQVYISTPSFAGRGIHFQHAPTPDTAEDLPLATITIGHPEDGGEPVRTEAGAAPGMTYGEIRELYPDAAEETKNGDGGPFLTLSAREGDNEMVFLREDYSTAPLEDGQVVQSIAVRAHSEEMRGSC